MSVLNRLTTRLTVVRSNSNSGKAEVDNTPIASNLPKTLRSSLVQQGGAKPSDYDLEPVGQMLGKGKFGVVKLRHDKHTGEPRAVKVVEKPEHWNRARLVHEAKLMQNLDHPHISRLYGWHDANDTLTLVCEFCEGGEFLNAVNKARREGERLKEGWAAVVFQQLFEGIAYCHDRGMIHRDIKSANILLMRKTPPGDLFKTAPHAIITDVGLAQILDGSTSWFKKKMNADVKGTLGTLAPEAWRGSISTKTDMYSFGCVMFELFTDKMPYLPAEPDDCKQATWEKLYKETEEDVKQRLRLSDCSAEAQKLCMDMLSLDLSIRPTAKDVITNAWFDRMISDSLDDSEQMRDMKAVCEAACRWPRLRPLTRALCLKMASQSRGAGKFAYIFSKFDLDKNGTLSVYELKQALAKSGVDPDMASTVAKSLDYNKDGNCEYLEFAAACLSALGTEYDQMLRQEFELADTFCAGKLNSQGLNKIMDRLKPVCVSRKINIEDIDTDGDGQISFPEFAAYFGRPGVNYKEIDDQPAKLEPVVVVKEEPPAPAPTPAVGSMTSGMTSAQSAADALAKSKAKAKPKPKPKPKPMDAGGGGDSSLAGGTKAEAGGTRPPPKGEGRSSASPEPKKEKERKFGEKPGGSSNRASSSGAKPAQAGTGGGGSSSSSGPAAGTGGTSKSPPSSKPDAGPEGSSKTKAARPPSRGEDGKPRPKTPAAADGKSGGSSKDRGSSRGASVEREKKSRSSGNGNSDKGYPAAPS